MIVGFIEHQFLANTTAQNLNSTAATLALDSETGTIFSQPALISFKRDKNIGNFLVRSSFQTNDQSGTLIFWCQI